MWGYAQPAGMPMKLVPVGYSVKQSYPDHREEQGQSHVVVLHSFFAHRVYQDTAGLSIITKDYPALGRAFLNDY